MAKQANNNQQVKMTKIWVMEALIKLMESENFNEITISQIASEARIDRRTFYRHYKTKEQVLDEYLLSILMPHFELLVEKLPLDERQLSYEHFCFFEKHLEFLRLLKKQELFGYLLIRYQGYIKLFQGMRGVTPEWEESDRFRIAFKTGGFWNIVSEWIEDNPVKSPEEITDIIHTFLEGGIETLCREKESD